jgi:hypothetical protein
MAMEQSHYYITHGSPWDGNGVDHEIIRRYLALGDEAKIARTAAILAPDSDRHSSNPADWVNTAVELHSRAEKTLAEIRSSLLDQMNSTTLLALTNYYGISDPFDSSQENLVKFYIPSIAQVLIRLWYSQRPRLGIVNGVDVAQQAEDLKHALQMTKRRTSLDHPSHPYRLEECLRFTTGETQADWSCLRNAYRDYLVSYRTPEQKIEDDMRLAALKRGLSQFPAILANMLPSQRVDAVPDPTFEKERNQVEEFETKVGFLNIFQPGTPYPALVHDKLNATDVKIETLESSMKDSDLLILLESTFYKFWATHNAYYRNEYETKIRLKSEAAEIFKKKGRAGIEQQTRIRWLERVNAFLDCANRTSMPTSLPQLDSFLNKHRDDIASLENRSWDPVKTFFRTLWIHSEEKNLAEAANLVSKILTTGKAPADRQKSSKLMQSRIPEGRRRKLRQQEHQGLAIAPFKPIKNLAEIDILGFLEKIQAARRRADDTL